MTPRKPLRDLKQAVYWYLVNSPLYKIAEPLTRPLINIGYRFSYARWYNENQIAGRLVENRKSVEHHDRYMLYEALLTKEHLADAAVLYLEFGVYRGDSIKWWLAHNRNPDSRFVGFDSFQGLPEDWISQKKGTFSTNGNPPEVNDSRCGFQIGWFQDTLPAFLANRTFENRLMLHLDADLYSSTLFVMATLADRFKTGDIIIFDEFNDPLHEYRAFRDVESAFPLRFHPLAGGSMCRHMAFTVERLTGLGEKIAE